ncbi:ATP-binding protein, partial [bacterium]|nr:ATP-binding protein [bacterium]
TMSHEIRNPLNGIVASLEILSKSSDLQREKEYVDLAKVSAEHLWGLITDVLDLSKIEAGQIKLEKVPFSVQQEVYESVKICRAQADLKGICMTVDVDDGVAPLVEGDAFRLRQVLLNLLGNAIKFTPTEGRVSLSVELLEAPSSDEEVVLKFRVSDSGIGISEEQKRVIFQEYQQATGSIAGEFGGTGLGLSIAAKLIELMGGEISVESEMNVGTTFCFVVNFLPAESKRESSVPAASRPEDVPQLSILLAEDNRVNQRLMQSVLERRGHQVTIAENGEEAVSRFEREEFDLIFMDVRMPVLCGMEATARIRAKEKPRGTHVPIVALTAQALPGDREKLLREGMDGYLSKPVRQSDLFQAIAQVVKNQGETLGGGNVRHGLKSS